MSQAPNWAGKFDPRNERTSTLEDLFEEFKNCVGQHFGLDLSTATEESRAVEITLSNEDYLKFVSGEHPYLKEADIDTLYGDHEESGDVTANLTTSRIQTALEQYAIERLPELFDKKFSIAVDCDQRNYNADLVWQAVQDYSKSGLIKWPEGKELPTNEHMDQLLDAAWKEALALYTQKTQALPPH